MKKFFQLLILLLILSCVDEFKPPKNDAVQYKGKTDWLCILYMAADNDLDMVAKNTISVLMSIPDLGSSDKLRIIVFVDYEGPSNTYVFDIVNGKAIRLDVPELSIKKDQLSELDSGSGKTLASFISYAQNNYDYNKSALFIWNHGGGWSRSSLINHDINYDIAYDFNSNSYMKNNDVQQALIGSNIDILAMDACLMGMVETAYEMRKPITGIDYLVSSQAVEPAMGMLYGWFFSELISGGDKTSLEFARLIVDDYATFYSLDNPDIDGEENTTMSVVDLNLIGNLVAPLNNFTQYLETQEMSVLDEARKNSETFELSEYVDLYSLTDNFNDTTVVKLKQTLKDIILYSKSNSGKPDAHGLSINFSTVNHDEIYSDQNNVNEVDFLDDFLWDNFLQARTFGYTIDTDEPANDVPGNKIVNKGERIYGYIIDPLDIDYYSFTPTSSGSISVSLKYQSNECLLGMRLYKGNVNSEPVASTVVDDTGGALLKYDTLQSGVVYHLALVAAYGLDLKNRYALELEGSASY